MAPLCPEVREPVRCPSPTCAALFHVDARRLGRAVRCPECGVRLTARPPEVAARLAAQEERSRGGAGAAVARLPLAVLVDNVRSLWNVGSIFRTADGCGVREVVLSGITGCPPRAQIAKTALGADEAVAWRYRADPRQALDELIGAGYAPVALETTARAVPLERLDWPPAVCLIVGNEVAGIGAELLDDCPHHVAIPMRGVKDSLNVAVAFGIAAYHAGRALERDAAVDRPRRPA